MKRYFENEFEGWVKTISGALYFNKPGNLGVLPDISGSERVIQAAQKNAKNSFAFAFPHPMKNDRFSCWDPRFFNFEILAAHIYLQNEDGTFSYTDDIHSGLVPTEETVRAARKAKKRFFASKK